MTQQQLQQLLSTSREAGLTSELDVLDERELEVFSMIGQGYTPSQMQEEIGVTPSELKALKRRLQSKLDLKDEVALVRKALNHLSP